MNSLEFIADTDKAQAEFSEYLNSINSLKILKKKDQSAFEEVSLNLKKIYGEISYIGYKWPVTRSQGGFSELYFNMLMEYRSSKESTREVILLKLQSFAHAAEYIIARSDDEAIEHFAAFRLEEINNRLSDEFHQSFLNLINQSETYYETKNNYAKFLLSLDPQLHQELKSNFNQFVKVCWYVGEISGIIGCGNLQKFKKELHNRLGVFESKLAEIKNSKVLSPEQLKAEEARCLHGIETHKSALQTVGEQVNYLFCLPRPGKRKYLEPCSLSTIVAELNQEPPGRYISMS